MSANFNQLIAGQDSLDPQFRKLFGPIDVNLADEPAAVLLEEYAQACADQVDADEAGAMMDVTERDDRFPML